MLRHLRERNSDYARRRPALYHYFAAQFGSLPMQAECASGLVYMQVSADASVPPALQLDPDRVFGRESHLGVRFDPSQLRGQVP